jgi:hypothetical protein
VAYASSKIGRFLRFRGQETWRLKLWVVVVRDRIELSTFRFSGQPLANTYAGTTVVVIASSERQRGSG